MKNALAAGDSIQLIAGVGGVTGGTILKQGSIIGVVVASALEGEQFTLSIKGAFSDLPKATGQVWAIGDNLYWDATAGKFTTTAAANTFAALAYAAALTGDTTGSVLLKDVSSLPVAANVAQNTTANGSDAATTQALANSLKTTVNGILTALKNVAIMTAD